MPYTQFVEIGRIAVVTYGPLADQAVVIVDIVDDKRVLIDTLSQSTEPRQTIAVKRLRLTDIVVKIDRAAAPDVVAQAVKSAGAAQKWAASKWAKRLAAQHAKLELNDFQRFKYAKLEAQRKKLVKEQLAKH